ncbi:hypothetical protein Tco_0144644 [Tanacetum coccineum]
MIQVKEIMQDNDLKNSKSKDKGSKSRSQSINEQSRYKQDKTITSQSINVKRHIFDVIGGTEEFEERDLNIEGDYLPSTYKGLMEKTYTWGNNIGQKDRGLFSPYMGQYHKLFSNLVKNPREILATEKVAKTFEQPPRFPGANWSKEKNRYSHFHEDYGHETNHCRELKHQIEEAVKSGQLTHLVKGVKEKKEKTTGTRSEESRKEEKRPTLDKASVLMISRKNRNEKKRSANHGEIGEITFPPLPNVGSADPVIINACI